MDAFGVSGYEGAFRRACEVTLQVYTGFVVTGVVKNLIFLWYSIINKSFFVVVALLRLQASWDSSGIFLLGSTDGYN